jgi:hypothetical protein
MGKLASISAGDPEEAVRVCPTTTVINTTGADSWTRRFGKVFRTIRAFCFQWFDASAYQHVSLGREVSMVLTANGPLVYRWESKNKSTKPHYGNDEERL